ncbi:MAG: hemerythrin domain-containing protein [Planctomycetota bacterium]|jgi:hemerythrin-like domain-containing protein
MNEHELATWIQNEHDQVEELGDRLRERVAIVPRTCTESWLDETRDRFEHFRAHLQKHMALEEKSGYMAAVVERRPALSDRVDRLQQEHRDLVNLLDALHHLFAELTPKRRLLLRDFCQRVQYLLAYVEHHENEENDLIGMAYCEDMGTKD